MQAKAITGPGLYKLNIGPSFMNKKKRKRIRKNVEGKKKEKKRGKREGKIQDG